MRVLIVEDDRGASRFIKKGLTEEGFVVETVFDGEEGLFMATQQQFDLIILDIMLPEMNGFEVIKGIRAKGVSTPVIFLTAKDQQADLIHGFDLGADDYLIKPFAFAELPARIRAVSRRGQKENDLLNISINDLCLNRISRSAERGGAPIELSAKEYLLLEYLMLNAGHVLTRTMILEHVWGYNFDTSSNIIDVHINRVRSKVDKEFPRKLIHTIKGVGYVLKAQD
jgi:heavy metal response regulator